RRDEVGSVARVPAPAVETTILRALRQHCPNASSLDDRALIERHLVRAALTSTAIEMTVKMGLHSDDGDDSVPAPITISTPWSRRPTRRARAVLAPETANEHIQIPIRAETRSTLVRSIALGRRWLAEITQGNVSGLDVIAARERCSPRRVAMMISLAFIAPDLVKAAIEGRLPRGIGFTRLTDPPMEWSRQKAMLGL
ncbi:MAG: hypothetical protein O9329_09070, partial [Microcystis sp. LE19-12.2C]|nr:hypothetical protein [Microcystis sp. LE19-12.2C]